MLGGWCAGFALTLRTSFLRP